MGLVEIADMTERRAKNASTHAKHVALASSYILATCSSTVLATMVASHSEPSDSPFNTSDAQNLFC